MITCGQWPRALYGSINAAMRFEARARGTGAGAATGLLLTGDDVTIRELAVGGWGAIGIDVTELNPAAATGITRIPDVIVGSGNIDIGTVCRQRAIILLPVNIGPGSRGNGRIAYRGR